MAQDEDSEVIQIGTSQPRLAKCVAMLLDGRVHTATLLDGQDYAVWLRTGDLPPYQAINRKAIQLRSCSVYFSQGSSAVACDAIWRERLGGYGTQIIEVPEGMTEVNLIFLAKELAELLPGKREVIRERLAQLLDRQRRTQARGDLAVNSIAK
ncbi:MULTISPECIES: hypothetical protein [Pirellulaceae]|uniref:hypothetical protein n=1 Tax=Pirellulaceae TaxID=2691357 RepID=UPI0011B0E519|nr:MULTISPECIES: hypothetical protein [Pirellulaceae]